MWFSVDYITIMTEGSLIGDSLNFAFLLGDILIGAILLFSTVRMGRKTKVAIGVVAVLSYLQFAGSGDVPRDNEAEIERAHGLSAEDMKTRMHAVDEGPDVFTIMESPGGGTGRYLFDTGSGLQRIIITTEPKDSKGDLHMTMYNEDGSPIRPAPSGERARTVGNGHIVSWSPQPDGDDGGDGAVPGGDRVDDGHHRVNTAAPSDVI